MTIAEWPARRWIVALFGLISTALVIGIPTGIVQTPFYHRMTPVLWWNYPVWIASSMLSGLILATYVRTQVSRDSASRFGIGGSVLSLLAVGCPICNKVVVMAIGVTGALNVWAPMQPLLGVFSVVLLLWALRRRLTGERFCAIQPAKAPTLHPDADDVSAI